MHEKSRPWKGTASSAGQTHGRLDAAAPPRYCTITDNVTPGGSVTVS
jgi:hypothetical protein